MKYVSAATARCLIARAILNRQPPTAHTIGSITLRAHQHAATRRSITLIDQSGGALLAERVGLGKTYTALAVAAHFGDPVTIVAPSSLRAMWHESLSRVNMRATIVTHEALSRGATDLIVHGFIIVDEAHRARSPSTHRYAGLARLCANSRVLLVSATPVQNRRADLAAQLALFLGRRAWEMREDELASYVVRGGPGEPAGLPRLSGPHRVELSTVDDCLEEIVALPSPVPAEGESVVAALLTYGLIHQWSSSRAAIAAALNRRRARGLALLAAIDAGRRPTRAELAAWTHTGDALQLAFPELVTSDAQTTELDASALSIAVDRHNTAVDALVHRLHSAPDPDDERASALRRIRARHPGERIIAFCHYAETVNMLRVKLARDSGVAALTASGARVASGRCSRESVLMQFTPHAERPVASQGAPTSDQTEQFEQDHAPSDRAPSHPDAHSAERIDLLLTTDLLSEGLNLQRASVIVHLDLPWNPARLDQRVGRVRRIGSHFEQVTVYAIAPPAAAEKLLRIEQRLRDKLIVAQRAVGIAGRILPSPLGVDVQTSGLAEQAGAIDGVLQSWSVNCEDVGQELVHASLLPRATTTINVGVATVCADCSGFVAVIRDDDGASLVADVGSGISTATDDLLRALNLAEQTDVTVDAMRGSPSETTRRAGDESTGNRAVHESTDSEMTAVDVRFRHAATTLARIAAWLDARRGAATIDLTAAATARSRRATLLRVSQTLERTPRHRRAQLAPLADAARAVATAPLGEGAERVLDNLAAANLPDEAWLRSIATFAALNTRPSVTSAPRSHACSAPQTRSQVECLILFESDDTLDPRSS